MRGRLSEEAAINCPGCGAKVAADTSICPKCDYIIDSSFLAGDVPAEADDDEGTPSAPPLESGSTRITEAPSARAKNAPARQTGTRPAVGRAATGQRPAAPARQTGARPAQQRRAPASPPEPEPLQDSPEVTSPGGVPSGKIAAPEDLMRDVKSFVGVLGAADKWAIYGAAGTVITTFLPWRYSDAEGDVLGLTSLGFVAFLLALITIGVVVIRVQRLAPRLNPLVPWVGQLASASLALLWCIICIKLNSSPGELPRAGMPPVGPSSASFGVFLAVLTSAVSLGGTLLGLKEKPT